MELYELSLHDAGEMLRRREISARDLTEAELRRIEEVEPALNAYISVTPDVARAQADDADKRLASGTNITPLTGIPMGLKDLFSTRGIPTTCGSNILRNFVPLYDSFVTRRLREAGAVLLGKNNMDEFAMGSSTEHSAFGQTHNPWDTGRVPGGSSGGSAAAVSAGEAFFSVGTDTGGSIRQPASLCNVAGMKPTYGRVSRSGVVAFASSLDHPGPFARNTRDLAHVLQVIAGHDPMDSTSINAPVPDYVRGLEGGVAGMRFALPRDYFVDGMEQGVRDAIIDAVRVLQSLGAIVEEVEMATTKYALATYYIIAPAEASANLARYDGVKYGYSNLNADPHRHPLAGRDDNGNPITVYPNGLVAGYLETRDEGFGAEVKRRIMIGTYALSSGYYDAYYIKAQKVRTLIKQDFDRVFQNFDAIIAGTSPTVAFQMGAKTADPLAMYLNDVLTIPANMAGIPALTIPGGFSEGLPVGLQIIGPALSEDKILRIGHAYEQATDWHTRRPQIAAPAAHG